MYHTTKEVFKMVSYKKIDEKTVRNIVHKASQFSTAVRVPFSWIGKEVEVRLIE